MVVAKLVSLYLCVVGEASSLIRILVFINLTKGVQYFTDIFLSFLSYFKTVAAAKKVGVPQQETSLMTMADDQKHLLWLGTTPKNLNEQKVIRNK